MKDRNLAKIIRASMAAELFLVTAFTVFGSAQAQVSAISFKNFHRYPSSGLWQQELSGTRNGVSLGPPITSSSCAGAGAMNTTAIGQLQKLQSANSIPCKTTIILDTERVAEYERTCMVGRAPRVMHSTLKSVDDKTMTVDTLDQSPGFMQTAMHSKVTYLGACSASEKKPSAAECAELNSNTKDLQAFQTQCDRAPPTYHAQCVSQLNSLRASSEVLQKLCE